MCDVSQNERWRDSFSSFRLKSDVLNFRSAVINFCSDVITYACLFQTTAQHLHTFNS